MRRLYYLWHFKVMPIVCRLRGKHAWGMEESSFTMEEWEMPYGFRPQRFVQRTCKTCGTTTAKRA